MDLCGIDLSKCNISNHLGIGIINQNQKHISSPSC